MIDINSQDQIDKMQSMPAFITVANQQSQLDYPFDPKPCANNTTINKVVIAGMGGSALAAEYIKTWLELLITIDICRDYQLPSYVGEDTLVIVFSFSGNTEEALSCLDSALANNYPTAIICAGGKLHKIATDKNLPVVLLDNTIPQPRMSLVCSIKAILTILEVNKIIDKEYITQLENSRQLLVDISQKLQPTVSTKDNPAKQLASDLLDFSPVVYAEAQFRPVAYKFKISFNENSKNVAWYNLLPEVDHNEFIGWSGGPEQKLYKIINLRSNLNHPRTNKRFDVQNKFFIDLKIPTIDVWAKGDNFIEQLLYLTVFGDFTSLYLAMLNEVDPEPVDLVEDFKKALND